MKAALWLLAAVAFAKSPTDSYAPGEIDCPEGDLIRAADGVSEDEADWIKLRHQVTDKYLETFLNDAGLDDFSASDFLANTLNNRSLSIGLAFSGGGYRAMLSGAGQLAALDNRTDGAHSEGLGGLLQASTYLAGLSGGNWLVGSVVLNNFTSVQDIVNHNTDIWDLEHLIVNMGGWNLIKAYSYYKGIYDDIQAKEDAGFELSLTDTWGRALSHQFFPELTSYGLSMLWSDIQDLDAFSSHEMPFPVVVANGRTPGETIISGNSTVFEVNPFELGSWDPSLYLFLQTKYLGTTVSDGDNNGTCIGGFDNAGFVMGTSSTLFNQFVLQINTTLLSSALKSIVEYFLDDVSADEDDIAIYKPNPFKLSAYAELDRTVSNDTLYLVDGGEDLQNVPLYPLIQPHRNVDVIFAYDNSADTDQNWPNGTLMIASYQRQFLEQGNGTIFPYVPDSASFRNLNLTARPAFFGCSALNLLSLLPDGADADAVYDSPLIVYTANRPFTYYSNTSTFKLSYEDGEKRSMIRNGFEVASRLNMTIDEDWKTCVACAIIRREQERQNITQSEQCQDCFDRYCWDSEIDTATPGLNFTTEGTTDGDEDTGNTTSSAYSVMRSAGGYEVWRLLGYCCLAVVACTYTIF